MLNVLLLFCVFPLLSSTVLDLCALPASGLTHQVHPGCSVAQRHDDPGGRVSDDLVTHITLTFLFSFALTRGCSPAIRLSVRPAGIFLFFLFFNFTIFSAHLLRSGDQIDSLGLRFSLRGRRLQCHSDLDRPSEA